MADLLSPYELRRITVTLAAADRAPLRLLAQQERRDTRLQAAVIIRRELQRRGLLPEDDKPDASPAQDVSDFQARWIMFVARAQT